MPKIPRYDSQSSLKVGNVSTAAPAVQIDASSFTYEAKAMGQMGEQISAIGEKIYALQAQNELSKAKVSAYGGLKGIEETQDIDPNGWMERRAQELQKVQTETLKQIKNPLAKQQFQSEFARDVIDTQYRLKKTYTGLTIGQTLKSFYDERQVMEDKVYSATSESEKQLAIDSIGKRYAELGRSGAMTPQAALKEFQGWERGLVVGKVKYDIYNDSSIREENSFVLSELKKQGDTGIYKDLTAEERLELIQDSQRRIFQNNQTFKRENEITKDARFNNIFDKINTGTLTLQDIDNEFSVPEEAGGIPKKDLLAIKKGILDRTKNDLEVIVGDSEKAADYLRFIDNYIKDTIDRDKAREYLANAYKDQILSPQEALVLNKIKKEAKNIKSNNESSLHKSVMQVLMEQMGLRKLSTEQDSALAIKKLLNGLSEGKNPQEELKEILYQEAIKKNPSLLNIPEGGQVFMDADGTIKMVLPDTSTKDYKNTSTKEK